MKCSGAIRRLLLLALTCGFLFGAFVAPAAAGVTSWSKVMSSGGDFDKIELSRGFASDRTIWVSGYESGLWRSSDAGASWTALTLTTGHSLQLPSIRIQDFAASPAYTTDHTVFVSAYEQEWSGYFLFWWPYLYRSYQADQSPIVPWFPVLDAGYTGTVELAPDYASSRAAWVGLWLDGRIGHSDDRGETWNYCVMDFPAASSSEYFWNTVLASPSFATDRTVWAAGWDTPGTDENAYPGHLVRSTDGGHSFNAYGSGLPTYATHQVMAASPNYSADHTLMLVCSKGAFRSTDGGATWAAMGGGLPAGESFSSVAFSPAYGTDRTAFITGPTGVYHSKNGGATWASMNTGLGTNKPRSIAPSPAFASDRTVYLAADTDVWSYTYPPPGGSGTGKPKVTLGTPTAPKTMKKSKSYTVYGSLKPKHAKGTKVVRIYKYKKVGEKWVKKGFVTAKAYNYKSYTRYKVKMKLTSKGTWRLQAYAPADSKHAATWAKKYDTVKVR